MSKHVLILASFLLVACGSSQPAPEKPIEKADHPSVQSSQPGPDEVKEDTSSQVLTKNKKCPKKSKLVNGKCVMQVESSD